MSIQTNLKHLEWSITNGDSLLIDPGKAAQLHAQITEVIAERDALKAEAEALRELAKSSGYTDAELNTIRLMAQGVKPADLHKYSADDPTHTPGGLSPLSADMRGDDKPGMG